VALAICARACSRAVWRAGSIVVTDAGAGGGADTETARSVLHAPPDTATATMSTPRLRQCCAIYTTPTALVPGPDPNTSAQTDTATPSC